MTIEVPARVAAIRQFREHFRKTEGARRYLKLTREEHLAYCFIRGRFYQQAERLTRKEKPNPYILGIIYAIKKHFGNCAEIPEDMKESKYVMPRIEYLNLEAQIGNWLKEIAPDQDEWLEKFMEQKAEMYKRRALSKAKFTPEYIESLRNGQPVS
jgi:hypothetical protein